MSEHQFDYSGLLDERGRVDDSLAGVDGVSVRSVRETVATARALEALPEIAAVAAAGGLSADQLAQVVKVADPSDDHRWAAEAASWSPADLADQVRKKRKPTAEDAAARRGSCGSGGDATTGCSTAGSPCPTSTVPCSSR